LKEPVLKQETRDEESGGNGAAVESEESQEQASHSSHKPLGNPAKSGRGFPHSHPPVMKLMEKCKTKNRFYTFPQPRMLSYAGNENQGGGLCPAPKEVRNVVVVDPEK
jgi:hypothetical protein